ncbi:MAG: formylglycine-generating enzyme family protein [Pseudomonadota bacterium]
MYCFIVILFFVCFSLPAYSDNLSDSKKIMDWAEQNYPDKFPSDQRVKSWDNILFNGKKYVARHYFPIDTYVATSNGLVYIFSKKLWGGIKEVGTMKSFLAKIPQKSFSNGLGMLFNYIYPGSFLMGSPVSEPQRRSDEQQHKVSLTKGFYISVTTITQDQWMMVMNNNPSFFAQCGGDCPVESVGWNEVQKFIAKMNQRGEGLYRLLTEAEWEYAARAGTVTAFTFGDNINTTQVNYNGAHPYINGLKGKNRAALVKVSSLPSNAWGLYEVHGNVWEWVQDKYAGNYSIDDVIDPKGPLNGPYRVIRGGSLNDGAGYMRSAFRLKFSPKGRSKNLGFRLALMP